MTERFAVSQRAAEEMEHRTLKESGVKVPCRFERAARRILGLRQLELAERKGNRKGKEEGDRIVAEELGLGPKLLDKLDSYLEISPAATGVGFDEDETEMHHYPYLDPWEKEMKVAPLQEIVAILGTRPSLFAIKAASDKDYKRLLYNAHRF